MIIIIDGKSCEAKRGEVILEIAKRNSIYIPTLCHSDALKGLGSCRLCVVEVVDRGRSKVVTSCLFPVEKEVEVITNSEKIKRIRKNIMTLLKIRCPKNVEVAKMAKAFGVEDKRVERFKLDDTQNCILCGLCVKACTELGTGAISTIDRGIFKEVNTPYQEPSATCIGCGSCANVCPTGAIEITDKDGQREIWGKKFELLKCDCCGEYFTTKEHMEFAYEKAGVDLNLDKVVCPDCKRKYSAKKLNDIFS